MPPSGYWPTGWQACPLFDAVNHSFAAVSTGGFSTRADSIGYWDSAAIEAVTLPLMVLGNLSFVTAWSLWRGKLSSVVRNGEVRLMAAADPFVSGSRLRVHLQGPVSRHRQGFSGSDF